MNKHARTGDLTILLALLVLSPVLGWAQTSTTAALTGTIVDPTGAVLPDAKVTIIGADTGLTRTVSTSSIGLYTFNLLPVGTYDLSATKQGFQTLRQKGIVLNVSQTIQINLTLRLGQTTQTVEVKAQTQLLALETSNLGQVVERRNLDDLPLNGRNPLALTATVVGATVVSAPPILAGYRGGARININGNRFNEINYQFDGNNYSCVYMNTGLNYPNPDALQEFKVITHNYSADYGRNAGAVLAGVTKSGTNGFHGDLWEFLRNDALNARNFFSKSVPILKQNQFGVVAGGPIKRDKLFVFGSYQGFRIHQQSILSNQLTGTAAERDGDFSKDAAIKDPKTGQPFPGNLIPGNRIITSAQNWYKQYSTLPNNPDNRTFTWVSDAPNIVDQLLFRTDWHLNSKQNLSFRWFRDVSNVVVPFGGNFVGWATYQRIVPMQDVSVSHTWMISPMLLNQAHVGINHGYYDNGMTPDSYSFKVSYASLGINMPPLRPYAPQFNISGYGGGGPNVEAESGFSQQYSDTLSWVHGKHVFKFGMEFEIDAYHNRSNASTDGNYSFNGQFTGNPLADFLLGLPNDFNVHGRFVLDAQERHIYPFIQDDIKVSPHLTLNIGLRWEFNTPMVDHDRSGSTFTNQQATFIPLQQSTIFALAPIGLNYPGDPRVAPGMFPLPKTDIEPRFGFAWNPAAGGGNWVVRGGFGIFADTPIPDLLGQGHANQPFTLITDVPAPAGGFLDPLRDWVGGNPWPAGNTFDPNHPFFTTPATTEGTSIDFTDPRIYQWNLNVQRKIGKDWLFDVAYVGNRAYHLNLSIQANPAVYIPGVDANGKALSTAANVNSRRIYSPGIIGSAQLDTPGDPSNFNALEFTVRKSMGRGLMLLSSYTYSHALDIVSVGGAGGFTCQTAFNCRLDHGNADFDRRHVYTLSAIYDIPKLPGSNFVTDHVLAYWEMGGIFTARTGQPFSVKTGPNNLLNGDGQDRPDLVGNPNAVDRSSRNAMIQHWFNAAAFVANPIGSPGTAGRNILFQPNFWNYDFSILRTFPISEKWGRLQFRAEFFNIFNNVNLQGPSATRNAGNFTHLTTAADPRLIQFGLKYYW